MSLWSRLFGERRTSPDPLPSQVRAIELPPHLVRLGEQLAAARYDVELQRIYADALIEQGGDHAIRGELIQLELTDQPSDRRRALTEALARVRTARGLRGLGDTLRVGLATDWKCSADQFARFGESAFAEEPVLRGITIELHDAMREVRVLAATPNFARLRSISIIGKWTADLGETGIATLLASPYWPRDLDTLWLANCHLRDAGAVHLANAAALARLETLELWANHVQERGLIALARSPHLGSLQTLGLWQNLPGERAITALAAPANTMQLARLRLDKRQMFPAALAAIRARFPAIEIDDREPAR